MGWKGKIVGKVGHYLSDSLGSPIKHLYSYASPQNVDPRSTSRRHQNLPYVNTEHIRDAKQESDPATRDANQENDSDTSITTLLLSLLSSSNTNKPSGSMPAYSERVPYDIPEETCTRTPFEQISEMSLPTPETLDDDVDPGAEDGIKSKPESTSPAHQFKLPPMSENSLFLSESLRECIYSELPNIVKGRHWVMLYSTAKHGISLRTLYRRSSMLSEPFLLVAGDFHGVTFGGLVTAPLEPTSKPKYSGTSDTFVFTSLHEKIEIFKATGANRYYILCMNSAISFGGGGHYALHLDEDLLTGSSGACDTFGNCCLATSMEFSVSNVEAMEIEVNDTESDYLPSMPPSFQAGVKRLISKSSRSPNDATSSESSSRSTGESSSSWSSSKPKDYSRRSGIVNVFGGCFAHSKLPDDSELYSLQVSDGTKSFKAETIQSFKSFSTTEEKTSGAVIFTMGELIKATNNFSPSLKIGQGGFGTVYRGKLKDGRLVAIKRAKKNLHDMRLSNEFRNEVATLSRIEHLNLVKFIGYADEGLEHVLVVEYVGNGNLREHLDGQHGFLDLATRLDIAIDIAHAITYLHLYADQSIIHRDIKSSNILLTENYRAKVADFGFSRLGPSDFDASHVSTQVKGTAGYLDPEYLKTYQLTQKSDVYSFGVLLVEILSGRRPIEQRRETNERMTMRWVYQIFRDGKAIDVLDPKLEKSSSACMMVEKLLELAIQCTSPTRQERPNMKQAAEVLWNIRKDYQSFWKERSSLHLSHSNSKRNMS